MRNLSVISQNRIFAKEDYKDNFLPFAGFYSVLLGCLRGIAIHHTVNQCFCVGREISVHIKQPLLGKTEACA